MGDNHDDPRLQMPEGFHEEDELKQLASSDDVQKLRSILDEDEVVLRLLICFHEDSDGVLAATDKRIVFADQRFITSKVVSFKYRDVAAIVYSPQIVTQFMTLVHSSESFTVTKVDKEQGERFINFIEPHIGENYTISGTKGRVFRHNEDQLQLEDAPSLSAELGEG